MRTTCGFYILNKDRKLLICHPTKHPDTIWSIPKGIKDKGEDELDAAKRELMEETNINFSILEKHIEKCIVFDKISHPKWNKGKKELFSALLVCDTDFSNFELRCDSYVNNDLTFPEIDEFRWVDLDESYNFLHPIQQINIETIKKIIS